MGLADEAWLEDQSYLLVGRMLATHRNDLAAAQLLPVRRASTRRELFRRIGLAVNFIHTQYDQPIGLTEIAAAAILSPYHCLRLFKTLHGVTPVEYLNRQRVRRAERLLRETALGSMRSRRASATGAVRRCTDSSGACAEERAFCQLRRRTPSLPAELSRATGLNGSAETTNTRPE